LHTGQRKYLIFSTLFFVSKSWIFTVLQVGNPDNSPEPLEESPSFHFSVAGSFLVLCCSYALPPLLSCFFDHENWQLWGRRSLTL